MVSASVYRIHPGILAAVNAVGAVLQSLARQRLDAGVPAIDPLRGLHLEASDVERLMARPAYLTDDDGARTPFAVPAPAMSSPLGRACHGLGLSSFETAVAVLCLLPEIDAGYGSLIGFLHDDVTRKAPSVELALTLFGPGGAAGLECLHAFVPEAPLRAWRLVHLPQDDLLIRQPLQLDRSFLWFLLGENCLDPSLDGVAHIPPDEHATAVPPALATLLERSGRGEYVRAAALLYSEDEHACLRAAATAGRTLGRQLLVIDGAKLAELEAEAAVATLQRCLREAVLKGWQPYVSHAGTLLQHPSTLAKSCRERIVACPLPVLLASENGSPEAAFAGNGIVPVCVPSLSASERAVLWQESAAARGVTVDEATLLALAETTSGLSSAAIDEVATVAEAMADAGAETLDGQHIQRAARSALRQHVASLHLMTPRYGWDDIILPPDRLQLLRHLCSRVRYRSQVRDTWGVGGATLPGVTALFAGQPGTGKSMAAEIVAADLGLDLYKIDLAQVVSKYIGETEKNLARIFNEAERSSVVLIFDEADAIFGKRSDVKDSHDRYANLEISYLLQRMERYRGLAILTTNLRANLDEAFTRRIGVSIDFPLPGPADRLRMWRRVFAAAPCDPGLDTKELAERLELTGGAIVNVAVSAAHLAAEERGMIDYERLLRAVRWELQKMGRLMGGDALDALAPQAVGTGRNGRRGY